MKSKIVLFIASALLAGTTSAFAGIESKTEKFKVHGNCGMCEKRIEQAATSVEGVSSAEWDKKSLVLTVAYNQSKTDVHSIHSAVAKAGHDTEMHRASDESYEKLHNCCKYKRAEKKQEVPAGDKAMPSCPHSKAAAGCCSTHS